MRRERGKGWEMHLGDCIEVMATLEKVDHVITDPPYSEVAPPMGPVRRIRGAQVTDYLQTRTGRLYWAEPERYVFTILEIAESLSRICRFNGHMGWESVATHSIRVARAVGHMPPRVQLAALLHDAHEAYIGDIPGPMLRAGLAGPLVAVGWGIQAAIIAQLAPACRDLNCAELAAIDREDLADCTRTLALGPPDYEPPWPPGRAGVADRFVALYGQLARECAS